MRRRRPSRFTAAAAGMLAGVGSFATNVYADGDAGLEPFRAGTDAAAVPGDTAAAFFAMGKVIFFLILIIGIFYLIMKVLAKKKWRWTPGGKVFHTLGGLPLGQNKSVQIVEIGRSLYILGVGDDVKLLHKIDDPEEIAYITAFLSPDSGTGGQGWDKLRDWLGRMKKSETETVEDENQVAATFQNVFQSKLKHMAGRKRMIEDMLNSEQSEQLGENRKLDS